MSLSGKLYNDMIILLLLFLSGSLKRIESRKCNWAGSISEGFNQLWAQRLMEFGIPSRYKGIRLPTDSGQIIKAVPL